MVMLFLPYCHEFQEFLKLVQIYSELPGGGLFNRVAPQVVLANPAALNVVPDVMRCLANSLGGVIK